MAAVLSASSVAESHGRQAMVAFPPGPRRQADRRGCRTCLPASNRRICSTARSAVSASAETAVRNLAMDAATSVRRCCSRTATSMRARHSKCILRGRTITRFPGEGESIRAEAEGPALTIQRPLPTARAAISALSSGKAAVSALPPIVLRSGTHRRFSAPIRERNSRFSVASRNVCVSALPFGNNRRFGVRAG